VKKKLMEFLWKRRTREELIVSNLASDIEYNEAWFHSGACKVVEPAGQKCKEEHKRGFAKRTC
jgi:hypothetical protein